MRAPRLFLGHVELFDADLCVCLHAAVKAAAMHLVAKWQKVQERAHSTGSAAAAPPKRKADSTDGELTTGLLALRSCGPLH